MGSWTRTLFFSLDLFDPFSNIRLGFHLVPNWAITQNLQKMLIEQRRGGILMESIALDTAACQTCVDRASSFWRLGSCFSKLGNSTANFAVANADKQNVLSANIKSSRKQQHLSDLCNLTEFLEGGCPRSPQRYCIYKLPINRPSGRILLILILILVSMSISLLISTSIC